MQQDTTTATTRLPFISNSNIFSLVVFLVALFVWSTQIFFGSFGDERENFVAGWFIYEGLVPYKDFFFHHAPLPFFLSAVGYYVQSQPWQLFRIFIFLWWVITGVTCLLLVKPKLRPAVALVWLVYALSAPLFHFQMMLAESIVTPALIATLFLLYSYWRYRKPSDFSFLLFFIIASWFSVWSTIVSIPPFAVIFLGYILAYYRHLQIDRRSSAVKKTPYRPWYTSQKLASLLLLFIVLHGISMLYFWWHSAIGDAFWAIVQYNTQHYFPLRLAHSAEQAKLGYGAAIATNFFEQFWLGWQTFTLATVMAIQTVVGLTRSVVTTGFISGAEWLVVWTEWYTKVMTATVLTTILSSLLLLYLGVRKQWIAVLWLLLFFITLRGRDNEVFKLGPYFLPIVSLSVLALVESFHKKQRVFLVLFGVILAGWIGLILPSYGEAVASKTAIFPPIEMDTATRIKQAIHSEGVVPKVLFLSGNPDYYLLTETVPSFKYYYYHPWFHAVESIQSEMKSFLMQDTHSVVILESGLTGTNLEYATELEELVKSKYATVSSGIYLQK